MNFSVVIPTYNRSRLLQKSLLKLVTLRYSQGSFEIVLVDNNSDDDTAGVIHSFIKHYREMRVRYEFECRQGRSFAFQKGVDTAKYTWVVSIDDDIKVSPDFLSYYAEAIKDYPQAALIGGKIVAKAERVNLEYDRFCSLIGKASEWTLGALDHGRKRKILTSPDILFAGNMAINRTRVKGVIFNQRLGRKCGKAYLYAEDYELCMRLHLQKQQILYEPKLLVENTIEPERLTLGYIWRRHLFAGIERYIVDKVLAKTPFYARYRFGISVKGTAEFLSQCWYWSPKYWVRFVNRAMYLYGYYILSYFYYCEKKSYR